MSYSQRVRFLSADQEQTGFPDKTRLNAMLKVPEMKKPDAPMKYAWLSEDDARYKSMTVAEVANGSVVPTIEKIFSDFKLSNLLVSTVPDDALLKYLSEKSVVPSVTTVPGFLMRDDGLARWKSGHQLDQLRQMLLSHEELYDEGPNDQQWLAMKMATLNYSDNSYAERGTRWHTAIELAIQNKEVGCLMPDEVEAFNIAIPKILAFIKPLKDYDLERTFIHEDGYGGQVDFRGGRVVIDWKTKDKDIFLKSGGVSSDVRMPEYPTQLGAYGKGLGIKDPILITVFIDVRNGDVGFFQYDKPEYALMLWESMLNTWYLKFTSHFHTGNSITELNIG